MKSTRKEGGWLPRLEVLAAERGLDEFDKLILLTLIGNSISIEVRKAMDSRSSQQLEVEDLLLLFCTDLEERLARRSHFYKNGALVREGIIRVEHHNSFGRDISTADVTLDRRMFEYLVGLDTEPSELIEGSRLYTPAVDLGQVVLPDEKKRRILEMSAGFHAFRLKRAELGLENMLAYGRGLAILFFGPSGTGKTMMANALAHHLGKKILLINFPSLGTYEAGDIARIVFREARISNAVVFFDECEAIFESREQGNSSIVTLLTEMERHDGLVILATNRPFDLDEAMHRRITLAVEFTEPDPYLREQIWRLHLPAPAGIDPDIDLRESSLVAAFECPAAGGRGLPAQIQTMWCEMGRV